MPARGDVYVLPIQLAGNNIIDIENLRRHHDRTLLACVCAVDPTGKHICEIARQNRGQDTSDPCTHTLGSKDQYASDEAETDDADNNWIPPFETAWPTRLWHIKPLTTPFAPRTDKRHTARYDPSITGVIHPMRERAGWERMTPYRPEPRAPPLLADSPLTCR